MLFTLCCFFVFSYTVNADEIKVYDSSSNKEIMAVYKWDSLTNQLIEVPISEYLNEIENSEEITEDITKAEINSSITKGFKENLLEPYASKPSTRTNVFGSSVTVSRGLLCPNLDGCPITISESKTITRSFSASVETGVEEIISSSIGYSYTEAKSGQVGTTYSAKVPYKKNGQIAFKPKLSKITGSLEKWEKYPASEYLRDTSTLTVYQPIKDGTYSDGYFLLLDYNTGAVIFE